MTKKIYFAHAVNSYNTPIESAAEALIAQVFADGDLALIENPNRPYHQKGYKEWAQRAKQSSTQHKGMNYFYDLVLPVCDAGIAMPFLDGKMGLGVAGEALWFLDRGKTAWFMEPRPEIGPKDLEEFVKDPLRSDLFRIRFFDAKECEMLRADAETGSPLVLSHIETRLRTWVVYGKIPRPYDEAHLASLPIPEGFYPDD